MGKLAGAPVLAVHHEEEDDELFETSSSISGDSDDEGRFSDGEDDGAQERQLSPTLYDLSSMMAQLPVKKGLSRYYDGKSQSFACMSEVRCLDDLRKKESPYKTKMKSCKSYVALDEKNQRAHHTPPGPNSEDIAKKPPSGGSCANLVMARNGGASMLYRPPPIPLHKNGYRQ